MSDLYIIENEQVIKLDDGTFAANLAAWEESRKEWRLITDIDAIKVSVSTVFLGMDHSFRNGEEPVLFETMIFGGKYDGQKRYCTAAEARKGHNEAVKKVNDTPLWEKIIHIPFQEE